MTNEEILLKKLRKKLRKQKEYNQTLRDMNNRLHGELEARMSLHDSYQMGFKSPRISGSLMSFLRKAALLTASLFLLTLTIITIIDFFKC